MSYRNDRFNRRMLSSDKTSIDPAKDRSRSDGGRGVERMADAIDYDEAAEDAKEKAIRDACEEKLFEAEMRLVEAEKSHLILTLLLIVENGSDREASMNHVPRATYFRHRNELCRFFCPHGVPGGHALPTS